MDDYLTGFAVERLQANRVHDRIANTSHDPVNALKGAAEALNLMFRPLNQGRWYAAVVDMDTRAVEFGVTSLKLENREAAEHAEDRATIENILFDQGVETIPLSQGVKDLAHVIHGLREQVSELQAQPTAECTKPHLAAGGTVSGYTSSGPVSAFGGASGNISTVCLTGGGGGSIDTPDGLLTLQKRVAAQQQTMRQTRAALVDRTRELREDYDAARAAHRSGKIMRDKLWEAEHAFNGAVKMLGTFLCYADPEYDVEDEAGGESDARQFAAEPRSKHEG